MIEGAPVNVLDYGAVGDNTADDTAAIQAAITAANANNASVYIPAGIYKVSSSISCYGNSKIYGDGRGSRINPIISDGTAVFVYPANAQFFSVEDLQIASSVVFNTYIAGGAAQNCTAIKHTTYANRFYYKNIIIYGVAVGLDISGFIGTLDNVHVNCCDVGLVGTNLNSSDINLRAENNKKAFSLTGSYGVFFRQLLDEGGHVSPLAATIDGCGGVHFASPYWEQVVSAPRATPYLSIGATTACQSIRITGMNLVDYVTAGTAMLSADDVDGLFVEGHVSRGVNGGPTVLTTSNTTNVRQNVWSNGALNASPWLTEGSKQEGACFNYFPNRNFDMWFRGWNNVTPNRSTFAQETTLVRKGANAVKITATAGQNFNVLTWTLVGSAVTSLRGKRIVMGAWVYVPDISEFTDVFASRTKFPSITLDSFNGSATVSSDSRNNRFSVGEWQFMWTEVTVQVDATQIFLNTYVNQSSNVANGNEYIVVDSIVLAEANTPFERLMNDDLPDSAMIATIGVNGKMISSTSGVPSDADQTYEIGDRAYNQSPAVGQPKSWVCTVAGSPGTWTSEGNL